jgi:cell division protein FtsN
VDIYWNSLSNRLPSRQNRIITYSSAFALISLILLLTVIGYSINSKPGSSFYALKSASKTFSQKILNGFEKHDIQPTGLIKKSIILSPQTNTPTPTITENKLSPTIKYKEIEPSLQAKKDDSQNNSNSENNNQVKGASTQNPQNVNTHGNGSSNSTNDQNNSSKSSNSENGNKNGLSKH